MDKAEEAIAGQGGYLLTNEQKKRLILAAQKAYNVQKSLGLADETFDVWRRAALADAVQLSSFRMVRQHQYNAALKYFLELAGNTGAAARVRPEAVDQAKRAKWALGHTCVELADVFGGVKQAWNYAHVLFKRIHRTEYAFATAKQVWAVIFTMKNRAKAKAKKEARHERHSTCTT